MTYQQYTQGNGADRSAREIQSDLGDIRSEIDHTLDALSQQLSPNQLIQHAYDAVKHGGGGEIARNLSKSVKENPIPLAMIAAGFGYLIYSDSQRRRGYRSKPFSNGPDAPTSGDEFDFEPVGLYSGEEGAHEGGQVGQRLSEGADSVRKGARDLKNQAQDKLEQVKGQVDHGRQWASDKAHHASEQARAAKDWSQELIEEQPLVLAGLGLALGAAAAALVPMSRKEHEVMGKAGSQLRTQAQEVAHEAEDKAKAIGGRVASAAKDAAKQEAESQGVSPHNDRGTADGPSKRPEPHRATYAPGDAVSPGIVQESEKRPDSATLAYGPGTLPSPTSPRKP